MVERDRTTRTFRDDDCSASRVRPASSARRVPLLIEAGYEVHAVGRHIVGERISDAVASWGSALRRWHRGIIQQVRPSHCLHLAWTTEPEKRLLDITGESRLAASESVRLAQAILDNGERLVVAGSCTEYMRGHPEGVMRTAWS
ncbi:MAG: hypothetical protein R3B91_20025 [Planctomycetaceae bacterium]